MTTDNTRTERRLEREAQTVRLGLIDATNGNEPYDACRVEVTYRAAGELASEHAGYFIVHTPELELEELDEAEQLEQHPATRARELVLEELERRYPNASYRSVDDVYAE